MIARYGRSRAEFACAACLILVATSQGFSAPICTTQTASADVTLSKGAWPLRRSFQRLTTDRFRVLEPLFPRLPGTSWSALIVYSGGAIEARSADKGEARWAAPLRSPREPTLLGMAAGYLFATGHRVFAVSGDSGLVRWSFGEEPADRPLDDPEWTPSWTLYAPTAKRVIAASDQGEVVALDRSSGAVLWRKSTRLQIGGLAAGDERVYLATEENQVNKIYYLDAESGRSVSEWTSDERSSLERMSLVRDASLVCLFSQRLIALDARTGALRSKVPTSDRFIPATLQLLVKEIIVSPDGRRLVCLDALGDLRRIWQSEAVGEGSMDRLWVQASEPAIFAASGEFVTAFCLKDGSRLWRTKVPGLSLTLEPKLNDQAVIVVAPLPSGSETPGEPRRYQIIALSRIDGHRMTVGNDDAIVTEPLKSLDAFYLRDRSIILVSGNQMIGYSAGR